MDGDLVPDLLMEDEPNDSYSVLILETTARVGPRLYENFM